MDLIYIKPSKLILNLSIHENQDRLNRKPINMKTKTSVCVVNLSISHYLVFTNGSKTKAKLGTEVFLTNSVFKSTRSKT